MGAKFLMCFLLIVLVASPVYCAELFRHAKTGMKEDEKGIPIKGISWSETWCPPGYHECDPSNCPGLPPGWTCCCRN